METTTYPIKDEMTTMNPNREYTTISPSREITTTPGEMSPEDLYNKYANTTPPFPLFPNVSPPVFSNLSASQQNACSSAEIEYTKQIKEAAAYINQENFLNFKGKTINNITINQAPIVKAAAVVQQIMNVSNSNSLNCVCNNVAAAISNNKNSSQSIEIDISNVKATNFNLTIGQQSVETTTVTNVLSEDFTNTVNNSIKTNLNIFASQVNKVKNASPTGLGNSQKFFNAIQNSLMNVVNNNTVSNTANSEFSVKNNKLSLRNIQAENININDIQNTVTNTYVKNVTDAITNNAFKNIGINTAGVTASMDNTVVNTKPSKIINNNNKKEKGLKNYYWLILFFVFYLQLYIIPYLVKHSSVPNPALLILNNPRYLICMLLLSFIIGLSFWAFAGQGPGLWGIGFICTICLLAFMIVSLTDKGTDFFGLQQLNHTDRMEWLRKKLDNLYNNMKETAYKPNNSGTRPNTRQNTRPNNSSARQNTRPNNSGSRP